MTYTPEKLADVAEVAIDNVHDMDVTLRNYAEAAAQAFIAALPDMIEPLKFWTSDTGDLCCDTIIGRYQIQKGGARWCCMYAMWNKRRPKGDDVPTWHKSEEAAKAAAQAHYVATSLSAFGVQGGEA